jgi:hypothetical protein
MRARADVTGSVEDDASLEPGAEPERVEHRTKR